MKILLVVYDNDSYIHWFPQGLGYIAAVLLKAGYEVEIYNQDAHHYPESHLQEYLDRQKFDVVGLSFVAGYYQYRKALKISEAINRSKNRPFYVMGGHGPSPEPEFFLKKMRADAIVIGEGETTVLELMEAIQNGQNLNGIKGIAFQDNGHCVVNERRALIDDIDKLPFPAFHLFPIEYYRLLRMPHCTNQDFVMPVLSGRGCTFECNFCYRMDKGFRPRSNEGIMEEIRMLRRDYEINYIDFSDELLMSSPDRTISLCEAFIKNDLKIKWDCNGRLNYARPEVLEVMKRAGCVFINYGIEAIDDVILRKMNKALTTRKISQGIDATLKAGISPGLNIIFGHIGDTKETLQKGVEFLLKYDHGAQMRTIRPVTPYPGCPLYYYAIEQKLLKDCEDFYEHKHINSDLVSVNFTDMTNEEFHLSLLEANTKLLDNYFTRSRSRYLEQMHKLYVDVDASFRGFRHT